MTMSPEKRAFIEGGMKQTPAVSVAEPAKTDPEPKTIELTTPVSTEPVMSESKPESAKRRTRSRSNLPEQSAASNVLDHVLVPVTVRLPHRMAQALRRAHLEQRLKHAKPDTQQEIVEQALGDWLTQQGFLD